jgi:predicted esterase
MNRDDLYKRLTTRLPLIKTLAAGLVVLLFILLNVYVLRNASSFVPSERTQRWILFHLTPAFWPDWIARALWTLAAGAVLAWILRFRFVQGLLEKLVTTPFPIRIEGIPFRFGRLQKLAEYPVERRIFWAISLLFQGFKRIFRPRHLPLFVVMITLLWTGYFVLSHFMPFLRIRPTLHGVTVGLLRLPFVLCGWLVVSPLYHLLAGGTLTWRLPIAVAVPFGLVMGGWLYRRRIRKFLLRDDIQPLLIRYSTIAGVVYALFLPSLTGHRYITESLFFRYYRFYIWEPFYQYWNEGVLSWRSAIFVLFYAVMAGVFHFGFRYVYYTPDRKKALRKITILAVLMFSFVWFFYVPLLFVLSNLQEGGSQIHRHILKLPSLIWECVHDASCLFLYFSELSWKLLVVPVLLAAMILSYVFNPFRRPAGHFSEKISYALFWTLLLASCFFMIIWKLLLLTGTTLLAYYVAVRDFGMPKIRIVLTSGGRKIAYVFLVGLLTAFDLFIVLTDLFVFHRCCGDFFYKPFADLMATGEPSWDLLGPVLVLAVVLAFLSWLIPAFPGVKSATSHREPVQKTFLYGSLAVILLLLNVLCFIRLFTTDASFPWADVRLWPWWAMILPVSLIVFSVSGLLLTRKTKPTVLSVLFLCFAVWPNITQAADNRITLLEPAKFVSAQDAREAGKHESRPGQDGFLAEPKIVDCFAAMEYHYTGGRYENEPIRFRLRMPLQMEPGKKYPMIVWFHGRGERGDDNTRQLAHLQLAMEFFAGPNQQDFFMLATQCPGDNDQWTRSLSSDGRGDAPITITGEIMEAVLREFPVDENRLSAFGFSSGGTGSWEFGRKSPRKLAALGSCSGNPVKDAKPEEYLGPAIWAFVNSQDPGVPGDDAVVFTDAINTGGGNAFLSLYEASGHDTWTRAMREEKIIGWLILQSLEKPGPPQGVVCRPLTGRQQFTRFGLPVIVIGVCLVPLFFKRRKGVNP